MPPPIYGVPRYRFAVPWSWRLSYRPRIPPARSPHGRSSGSLRIRLRPSRSVLACCCLRSDGSHCFGEGNIPSCIFSAVPCRSLLPPAPGWHMPSGRISLYVSGSRHMPRTQFRACRVYDRITGRTRSWLDIGKACLLKFDKAPDPRRYDRQFPGQSGNIYGMPL